MRSPNRLRRHRAREATVLPFAGETMPDRAAGHAGGADQLGIVPVVPAAVSAAIPGPVA